MEENIYTLYRLLERVREAVEESFPLAVWVRAEIGKMSLNRNGHCYLELIEKNALTGALMAQTRGIIWSNRYRGIATRFAQESGRPLEEGQQILALANVQYSEQYGISLMINDIDASFTAGEAFLRRQRIISRLTEEGMMDLNSKLELPELPRRLAVISSETAAGYGDFMEHLHGNPYGFKFFTELFQAPMQGSEAAAGIIAALDTIAGRAGEFDAALILRGGGSATDLDCFDDYDLAANIAQFPLPVLTAIGHERDTHVADLVAFEHLKTPTALADYFVDIIAEQEYRLQTLSGRLSLAVRTKAAAERARLGTDVVRLRNAVSSKVALQRRKVELLEFKIGALNPSAILAKGFTLTLRDGRRIVSAAQLKRGDRITTIFPDGNIESELL